MKTSTLKDAIIDQVKEFATNGTIFSIYDITVALRTLTASGALDIPEVKTANRSFQYNIQHTDVKSVFDTARLGGEFNSICTFDRNYTGNFFEYTPHLIQAPVVTILPVNPPSPYGGTPPPTSVLPVLVPSLTETERIKKYLTNVSFNPTIKQVQSAIKRKVSTGLTSEKIIDIIENDLGFSVNIDDDFMSKSVVEIF